MEESECQRHPFEDRRRQEEDRCRQTGGRPSAGRSCSKPRSVAGCSADVPTDERGRWLGQAVKSLAGKLRIPPVRWCLTAADLGPLCAPWVRPAAGGGMLSSFARSLRALPFAFMLALALP